jgi:hypothetical protein
MTVINTTVNAWQLKVLVVLLLRRVTEAGQSPYEEQPASSPLLELPDPALLKVLECCAANGQHSVFNVARAHSRLYAAAGMALRRMLAFATQPQTVDSAMLYLHKHGQCFEELILSNHNAIAFRQALPNLPQLSSLKLRGRLQLQPGGVYQGLLVASCW